MFLYSDFSGSLLLLNQGATDSVWHRPFLVHLYFLFLLHNELVIMNQPITLYSSFGICGSKLDLFVPRNCYPLAKVEVWERRGEGQNVEPVSAVISKAMASKRPGSSWPGYQDTPLCWCLPSPTLQGGSGGWVSSSHTASPLRLSEELLTVCHSISEAQIWSPYLYPEWPVDVFSNCLPARLSAAAFSLPPADAPLLGRPCCRESLKQKLFYLLSRQQSLLTALCSYLDACCQLLAAQSQLRWITLQWATDLTESETSPPNQLFMKGTHFFSGSLTHIAALKKV